MGPLHDVKVLELGQLIAGPFCTRVMAEFGAQVTKIETPEVGDPLRNGGSSTKISPCGGYSKGEIKNPSQLI